MHELMLRAADTSALEMEAIGSLFETPSTAGHAAHLRAVPTNRPSPLSSATAASLPGVNEAKLELAARELCRLRGEDPQAIDEFSDEPVWRLARNEILDSLRLDLAKALAGLL